ncbi:unnamed protein product [Rotaria socialis]|nr:unnamed protein product [Rotaria socialis]
MPFNYPNQPPIDFLNAQPLYGRPVTMHSFPDKVDVLIVGAGPAGLMAAHALSSFGISVRVIDQRPNSVIAGQADGIQPRTIEVLQSYGLASRLIKEGNQMWEHSFWMHDSNEMLKRTYRSRNVRVPNARYPFEVTLHQGAIENIFLDSMSMRGLLVDRPTTVHDWKILPATQAQNDYRIEVTLCGLTTAVGTNSDQSQSKITSSSTTTGENENRKETIIHAKYVIGCDGAHSWVRKKLGFNMIGEQTGKF